MAASSTILFVDAYDSFSENIIALLSQELRANVTSIQIDTDVKHKFGIKLEDFVAGFDGVVLGPGPGNPNEAGDVGILYDVFDAAAFHQVPVLGICLGFQVLCVKHGLCIEHMKQPCHGQLKQILYVADDSDPNEGRDIFNGVDINNIYATCYNSLGLLLQNARRSPSSSRPGSSGTNNSFSTLSSQDSGSNARRLRVLATDHGTNVMAIRHRDLPFWGLQFHPESCNSNQACRQLVKNWWVITQSYRSQATTARPGRRTSRKHAVKEHEDVHGGFTSAATESIVSQLLARSVTSCNVVKWKRVGAHLSRTQISGLINGLSQDGDIAMLESTRKGRFSIYAVTLNDPMLQNGIQDSGDFTAWKAQYSQSMFSLCNSSLRPDFTIKATREEVWNGLQSFFIGKRATGGPPETAFWGGFIGYLSYEHGLDLLGIDECNINGRLVPEISLMWVERSIIYDHLTNAIYIQSIRKDDQIFLETMAEFLSLPSTHWPRSQTQSTGYRSSLQEALSTAKIRLPNQEQYNSQFYHCQSELRAGNSYELCLTNEASITMPRPDIDRSYVFQLYQNLQAHNPVPFGAFLQFSGITVLGTSPEQYMSWSRTGEIDMIPMKGTVKRSANMTFEKAKTILSTPKESAENLMIADLIRHDLYNAVGHNSKVEVVKLCEVVEYETVYQLVSHIRAYAPIASHLNDDSKHKLAIHYGFKTLSQTVPPGSMTGAPKKRSCQILAGLEQRNRGVYSGVLGYMDVGGGGNWNVCIRTAFRCDAESKVDSDDGMVKDIWHLGAGGAITVLSDAEGEWQEMMVKLNSVLQGFKAVKPEVA